MNPSNDQTHFERIAQQAMSEMFATSPETAAFHRGDWIDGGYYRRHLVETVLRIRLVNVVNAFALYKIGCKDNILAQTLAQYLSERYRQEEKLLREIRSFDLSVDDVERITPFHSTDKLIGYLYLSIGRDGPLPAVVCNWLLEWYVSRYNDVITEAAVRAFGHDPLKDPTGQNQSTHSQKQEDIMWIALHRTIGGSGCERAEMYLRNFVQFIHEYFEELRVTTLPQPRSVTTQEGSP